MKTQVFMKSGERTFLKNILFSMNQTNEKYFSSQKIIFWDIFRKTKQTSNILMFCPIYEIMGFCHGIVELIKHMEELI